MFENIWLKLEYREEQWLQDYGSKYKIIEWYSRQVYTGVNTSGIIQLSHKHVFWGQKYGGNMF